MTMIDFMIKTCYFYRTGCTCSLSFLLTPVLWTYNLFVLIENTKNSMTFYVKSACRGWDHSAVCRSFVVNAIGCTCKATLYSWTQPLLFYFLASSLAVSNDILRCPLTSVQNSTNGECTRNVNGMRVTP